MYVGARVCFFLPCFPFYTSYFFVVDSCRIDFEVDYSITSYGHSSFVEIRSFWYSSFVDFFLFMWKFQWHNLIYPQHDESYVMQMRSGLSGQNIDRFRARLPLEHRLSGRDESISSVLLISFYYHASFSPRDRDEEFHFSTAIFSYFHHHHLFFTFVPFITIWHPVQLIHSWNLHSNFHVPIFCNENLHEIQRFKMKKYTNEREIFIQSGESQHSRSSNVHTEQPTTAQANKNCWKNCVYTCEWCARIT